MGCLAFPCHEFHELARKREKISVIRGKKPFGDDHSYCQDDGETQWLQNQNLTY
jgi:hypothetical protein